MPRSLDISAVRDLPLPSWNFALLLHCSTVSRCFLQLSAIRGQIGGASGKFNRAAADFRAGTQRIESRDWHRQTRLQIARQAARGISWGGGGGKIRGT